MPVFAQTKTQSSTTRPVLAEPGQFLKVLPSHMLTATFTDMMV